MKVTKDQAAKNRSAIVAAAASQIRSRGFDQVSVAEVAKASGLTHGALYSHYKSKEALQVDATQQAFEDTLNEFCDLPASTFLTQYLSPQHRDHPEFGCPNAALVSEVWRQPAETQQAFRDGLKRFVALTAHKLAPNDAARGAEQAISVFAAMVGGLALSRAVRDVDPAYSGEILHSLTNQLKAQFGAGTTVAPTAEPKRRGTRRKPGP